MALKSQNRLFLWTFCRELSRKVEHFISSDYKFFFLFFLNKTKITHTFCPSGAENSNGYTDKWLDNPGYDLFLK